MDASGPRNWRSMRASWIGALGRFRILAMVPPWAGMVRAPKEKRGGIATFLPMPGRADTPLPVVLCSPDRGGNSGPNRASPATPPPACGAPHRCRNCRRLASAFAFPSAVLGPVLMPPCHLQRPVPSRPRPRQGCPARVLAPHAAGQGLGSARNSPTGGHPEVIRVRAFWRKKIPVPVSGVVDQPFSSAHSRTIASRTALFVPAMELGRYSACLRLRRAKASG
jgi:hypothetical protein